MCTIFRPPSIDNIFVLLTVESDPNEDKRKHDEKLLTELSDVLKDYSQQRMRALHMSFRLYSNDEMRITYKEMMQSFQVVTPIPLYVHL